jgi:hypothetical protein
MTDLRPHVAHECRQRRQAPSIPTTCRSMTRFPSTAATVLTLDLGQGGFLATGSETSPPYLLWSGRQVARPLQISSAAAAPATDWIT